MGLYNNKTGRMQRHIYVWVGHTDRKDHKKTTRPGQDYTDLDWQEVNTKAGKRWVVKTFPHTLQTDDTTGKPTKMVKIYLPKGSYNFPDDSNGYSRNNRRAYIQMPYNCLEDAGPKYRDFKIVFLNTQPTFNVYFENRRLAPINGIPQYQPNVEKINITTKELMKCFKDPWLDKDLNLKKAKRKSIKPKHITKKKTKEVQVSEKDKKIEKQSQNESRQLNKAQSSRQTTSKSKQMLNNLKNRTSDFSQDKGRENALER